MEVAVASGDSLAGAVTEVIDAAYAVGEEGLWVRGATRTNPEVVPDDPLRRRAGRDQRRRGGGLACMRPIDASTADVGFISTRPEHWGGGIGRELVQAGEELMRSPGATQMRLELLVPKDGVHPAKVVCATGPRGSAPGRAHRVLRGGRHPPDQRPRQASASS